MYRSILCRLSWLGFNRLSVRTAYLMMRLARSNVWYESKLYAAADWYLYSGPTGLPSCTECYLPVLSDTEKRHNDCRDAVTKRTKEETEAFNRDMKEYQALLAAEAADHEARLQELEHLDRLMDSFCTAEKGCYEEGLPEFYGACANHAPEEDCHYCGHPMSECTCPNFDVYDEEDNEDNCEGCGNSHLGCICAELESLRAHNADPATRGSFWTA